MNEWNEDRPAGRHPGSPPGVRFNDPWAATAQDSNGFGRVVGLVPRRARNLVIAALAPVVTLLLFWSWVGEDSRPPTTPRSRPAADRVEPTPGPADGNRRDYAIALPALRGLPLDATPGIALELWVAWDPEVGPKNRIQRLLEDVRLSRIVPAATAGEPPAALLSVPVEDVGDLLYGDLYGALAVTVRP